MHAAIQLFFTNPTLNNKITTTKNFTKNSLLQSILEGVNAILPFVKMDNFARLWWYCATILLWWLVLITPIHADTMVDPLKIFWVLTNSSYLGMYTNT